jgi:hypothetical protein
MLKRELAAEVIALRHRLAQLETDNSRLARENCVLRGDVHKLTKPTHPPLSAYAQACADVAQL